MSVQSVVILSLNKLQSGQLEKGVYQFTKVKANMDFPLLDKRFDVHI